QFGLGGVPFLADARTRSISAENPQGRKGAGAKAVPEGGAAGWLGQGWKVRPCMTLRAGETLALADIEGPGIIQHIWITVSPNAYRDCLLRMYWDGEDSPSVEVPLGDFFCCGHNLRTKVNSLPIAVNPSGGFNSYWPLPFREGARITVENQRWEEIGGFFYQIDYAETEVPAEAAYLHAQWRRSMGTRECPEHVILDGVNGKGQYVGTYLAWTQLSDGWWGEGEIKFFIDGDTDSPTICGTGTEDYFGGAWCFGDTFSTAFLGYPLWQREEAKVPKHGLYRWHIMDPIRFDQDLRVTIQELGWWPNHKFQPLTDDVCSTGYWYQMEPHAAFPQIPEARDRWSR
ncbi:DUF2961 domain-containing protein, partial [bacterium]|nr:DUF2961 domain-containing protein [bacterium]